MLETPGVVYLLHFHQVIPRAGTTGVRHYMGWANAGCLLQRVARHKQPHTAVAVLRELHRLGGTFDVVRTWEGATPADERRWKRNGHIADKCPICRTWSQMEETPF